MSSKQILNWLEDGHEDISRLLAPTSDGRETLPAITHASHRAHNDRPGLPGAQAFDSDRISSSSSASKPPPGWGQEDKAKADRDEAHRRARRIREDADWLAGFVQRWEPHEATAKDRTLSAVNASKDDPCEHCATIGKWEEMIVESTVKGNLERPYKLGAWCYRFTLDTGSLPTPKQLKDHHDGVRVKRSA